MLDLETELRGALSDAANAIPVSANAPARSRERTTSRRMAFGLSIAGIVAGTAAIVATTVLLSGGGGSPPGRSPVETVALAPGGHLSARQLDQAVTTLTRRLTSLAVDGVQIDARSTGLEVHASADGISAVRATALATGSFQVRPVIAMSHAAPRAADSSPHPPGTLHLDQTVMRAYHRWNCRSDNSPTRGSPSIARYFIVGCAADGGTRYLLGPSIVDNSNVKAARAVPTSGPSSTAGPAWVVDLNFDTHGQSAFASATAAAYHHGSGTPTPQCGPPDGCNAIGIVLDGSVLSAPFIAAPEGITAGSTEISGNFTEARARILASIIGAPPLPTPFFSPVVTPPG